MTDKLKKTRLRRVLRVRKKLKGTSTKPRLSISKTNKHLSAQLIDDESSRTLASFGTYSKEMKGQKKSKKVAEKIGERIAEIALEKKLKGAIFDRGRFKYHGLLAHLADAARKKGLKL
jgi:large subunit ribosomal protein L18